MIKGENYLKSLKDSNAKLENELNQLNDETK